MRVPAARATIGDTLGMPWSKPSQSRNTTISATSWYPDCSATMHVRPNHTLQRPGEQRWCVARWSRQGAGVVRPPPPSVER